MSCRIDVTAGTSAAEEADMTGQEDQLTDTWCTSHYVSAKYRPNALLLTPASTTCSGLAQGSLTSSPDSSTRGGNDDGTMATPLQAQDALSDDFVLPPSLDDDFRLPPPAVPLDHSEAEEAQWQSDNLSATYPDTADGVSWSSNARLPQLRIRFFRLSPSHSPQRSPKASPKLSPPLTTRRRSACRVGDDPFASSLATRAQLREGATGAEDVLNRVRYDLMEADGFIALVDNVELPPLCRSFLLRSECKYGKNCRYQHVTPMRWLSGSSPPLVSSGSHLAHVEELEMPKLFALLDSAPSQTARHALLQTVAFILYRGEVVWCRHIGRTAARQLWDTFLSTRLGSNTSAMQWSTLKLPESLAGTTGGGKIPSTFAAGIESKLLPALPGNVWERILHNLKDPCDITASATALLTSSRSMHASCLVEDGFWELLIDVSWPKQEHPSLPEAPSSQVKAKSWRRYMSLAENLHLSRLGWSACASGLPKPASPKQSPVLCSMKSPINTTFSPSLEMNSSAPMVRVEVGFEVSMLRANSSLTVAASRKTNEVRLFQSKGLGRLPALRLKGRPGIDVLDLVPEHDMLAAGGMDGQITMHSISDPSGSVHRIGRVCKSATPGSGDMTVGSPVFSGFHFLPGSSGGQLLAASRLGSSAQILDVSSGGGIVSESKSFGDSQGLIACELLESGDAAVLMNAGGSLRLWDVRMPDLIHVADLQVTSCSRDLALSISMGERAAAIVNGSTIHWADLRAGCLSQVQLPELWPGIFRHQNQFGSARMVLARRGLVAAWFDGPTAPMGCWLGGGPALMPLMASETTNAVTATTLSFGGGSSPAPFAMALARPSRRRRRLVYEVCAAETSNKFSFA